MLTQPKSRVNTAIGLAALAVGTTWAYRRWKRSVAPSFRGKVVAITGGSRGLGLELARLWGAEGARVAICARTEADLEKVADEFAANGHDLLAVACDVTRSDQVESFAKEVVGRWGRIDVLVNNAGIIQTGPLACMTLEDFEKAMATHFWGPLHCVRAFLPSMLARGNGRIVNIASIGGEIAVPHLVPYCASKFALVGLSEGLSTELRSLGFSVTTVCPGMMRTGSPRNAEFKGQHRAEYAWFSIIGSLPVISINAKRAASHIVEACRNRVPFLRITIPARATVPLRSLFPDTAGRVLSFVQRLLPKAVAGDRSAKRGDESFSAWSPSLLTRLTEKAAVRNNEIR